MFVTKLKTLAVVLFIFESGKFIDATFVSQLLYDTCTISNSNSGFQLNNQQSTPCRRRSYKLNDCKVQLHPLWEETLKDLAGEALFPVLYHPKTENNYSSSSNDDDNSNLLNIQSKHSIDPEKALKKLLRRFQNDLTKCSVSATATSINYAIDAEDNGGTTSPTLPLLCDKISIMCSTAEERRASRKLLADLVLGTSIMRIRHFHHLLAAIIQEEWLENNREAIEDVESKSNAINSGTCSSRDSVHTFPFDNELMISNIESIIEMRGACDVTENISHRIHKRSASQHHMEEEVQKKAVRAMVDLHLEYMQRGSKKLTDNLLTKYVSGKSTVERISILHSLPIFFVEILVDQYGEKATEEMAAVFNVPGPITIRRNRMRCPSDEILSDRLLREHSITALPIHDAQSGEKIHGALRLEVNELWSPSKMSIWSLDVWKDGWFEVQDVGSQIIAAATEAKAGEVVVDYCAGNGGKTFALASLMYEGGIGTGQEECRSEDKELGGLIIAHDIVDDRLRQLKGSFDRVGLDLDNSSGVPSKVKVVTTLDPEIILEQSSADVVLVDGPCSSTGVLRRRPSQRFKLDKNEIVNKFPPLQLSILRQGAELVKVGGRLIYSTCSISRYENEDVVKALEGSEGFLSKWKRWNFDHLDSENVELIKGNPKHYRALDPSKSGSDGFFVARWKRIA